MSNVDKDSTLLEVRHLVKEFPIDGKGGQKKVHAVSDVSFDIYKGETLALVGESGCGKSTLGRTLINLYDPTSGEVLYEGQDIYKKSKEEARHVRRQMQIIFQDPYASLNPRMDVRDIIAEPLITYEKHKSRDEIDSEVEELMKEVGIPLEFKHRYPHQFSGGQRQRIGIARAIALHPKLIVCDEPVSALDVSIQSQVLNLLKDLQEEYGLTYLFISHDLSVVKYIADRVCVMFLGKMCEIADTDVLYDAPLHPYTAALLNAIPKADPKLRHSHQELLAGEIPSPVDPPSGCRFHTRCPYATDLCAEEEPKFTDMGAGHMVACHYPLKK